MTEKESLLRAINEEIGYLSEHSENLSGATSSVAPVIFNWDNLNRTQLSGHRTFAGLGTNTTDIHGVYLYDTNFNNNDTFKQLAGGQVTVDMDINGTTFNCPLFWCCPASSEIGGTSVNINHLVDAAFDWVKEFVSGFNSDNMITRHVSYRAQNVKLTKELLAGSGPMLDAFGVSNADEVKRLLFYYYGLTYIDIIYFENGQVLLIVSNNYD